MFYISLYGAPLAQRASYNSSLFGPDGTVNYDYIVTNSINSLLIGSRCIPNGYYPVLSQFGLCFKTYQKLCLRDIFSSKQKQLVEKYNSW